jgi:hypothetical protein
MRKVFENLLFSFVLTNYIYKFKLNSTIFKGIHVHPFSFNLTNECKHLKEPYFVRINSSFFLFACVGTFLRKVSHYAHTTLDT